MIYQKLKESIFERPPLDGYFWNFQKYLLKGTVMQIEKALINDRLRVSKVS